MRKSASKAQAPVQDVESSDEAHDEFAEGNLKDKMKAGKGKQYPGEETQVYDEILSSIFEKVPPGEGDEFAAVKP